MEEARFFRELVLLVAAATAGAALFERARVPAVVGFLAIGALVGPGGLGLVADAERVRGLAELGVVFLLFDVGLELPLDRVRQLWRRALAAGGLQVGATLLAALALGAARGWTVGSAFAVGAVVAMSSTALVVRLLSERDELDAPHGQVAVGILIFQDLCIVPILLLVPLIARSAEGDLASLGLALGRSALGLAALGLVARVALPRILERAARLRSRELFAMTGFLVVAGTAVAAEALGLTLAIGAFVGGLVLAASPWSHELSAEVLPLRGLLLGIFFTAVGMLFEPAALLREPAALLALAAGMIAFKAALVAAICAFVARLSARQSVMAGLSLAQAGEFAFVIATAAGAAGLLEPRLQSLLLSASIGTLAATPLLFALAPGVARRVAREAERLAPAAPGAAPASGHVVLVGLGFAGRTLARALRARGVPYTAIEANADTVRVARQRGEPVLWGDATRVALLERAGVRRARLVAIAISDPVATRATVTLVRRLAPELPILGRARFVLDADRLASAGATHVVAEEFESTLALLSAALEACGASRAAVDRFSDALRDEGYELLRAPPGTILDPWLAELLEEGAEAR